MVSFDEYAEAKLKLLKLENKYKAYKKNKKLNACLLKESRSNFARQCEVTRNFDEEYINCGSHEKYMEGNRKWQNDIKALERQAQELKRRVPFAYTHDVMEELKLYRKIETEYERKIFDLTMTVLIYEETLAEEEKRKNSEIEKLVKEVEALRRRATGE